MLPNIPIHTALALALAIFHPATGAEVKHPFSDCDWHDVLPFSTVSYGDSSGAEWCAMMPLSANGLTGLPANIKAWTGLGGQNNDLTVVKGIQVTFDNGDTTTIGDADGESQNINLDGVVYFTGAPFAGGNLNAIKVTNATSTLTAGIQETLPENGDPGNDPCGKLVGLSGKTGWNGVEQIKFHSYPCSQSQRFTPAPAPAI